jgi:IS1 family transposase/transposase-like protein
VRICKKESAMLCPVCSAVARRFGRDRHGRQRFQCPSCPRTFSDPGVPTEDRRRVPAERAVLCIRLLLEGNSIRSTERLTRTHRDTIMGLLVEAGENCQRFLDRELRGLHVDNVQADEIWAFVGCKEKTRERNNYDHLFGDAYCFTALERTTKLILAWHLGKRSPTDTELFAEKLARATSGRFQLTTDGFTPYRTAIPHALGTRVDFARLVKVYGFPEGEERRYSPPEVIAAVPTPSWGNPDMTRVCTSHVERSNLSIRMTVRRLTRLTNAFSKKWENHQAAMALFFAYYNYCRPHITLSADAGCKQTLAMASGLAEDVWGVAELLRHAASHVE